MKKLSIILFLGAFLVTAYAEPRFSKAEVSERSARDLINDAGERGFVSLYARTGLPPSLFPAFATALEIALDVRRDGWTDSDDATTQRLNSSFRRAYDDVGGKSLKLILELLS